ncbi:MAG: linear amide C-N hydrolase [Tatlockia sp.]|nr:linear amide C-N hydrolase [Tatlockia sp.]
MKGIFKKGFTAVVFTLSLIQPVNACTRALFVGENNSVITGRSMDWVEDMGSDLWLFPRGLERAGEAGPQSLQWTSKYGSIVASVYGIASADGMNEQGLVMNMLYLAESDYGNLEPSHPPMAISLWGQYALDNFATVNEAVIAMEAKPFYLIPPTLPNGEKGQVHLSLSDSSGDSAIFEYIKGKLVIHHGREYKVMTNSPTYSKQLALNEYWTEIGGNLFLPGTSRAADRFVRTSFYINTIPKTIDKAYIKSVPNQSFDHQAVAAVMSVMRAVSVPFGITVPNQPNIASTIWRTVSDQKNKIYYFDSSTRPNTFWITFSLLNFTPGAPIQRLALADGQIYSGEVSGLFKPAHSFKFMPAVQSPN